RWAPQHEADRVPPGPFLCRAIGLISPGRMRGAGADELTTAAIDCDVHPQVPSFKALFPYLEPYWRCSFVERGIPGFDSNSYPPNAPLSARPEWKDKSGNAATDVTTLAAQVFDRLKAQTAICNCLYGVELIFSEDMALAVARAVNDWIVKE